MRGSLISILVGLTFDLVIAQEGTGRGGTVGYTRQSIIYNYRQGPINTIYDQSGNPIGLEFGPQRGSVLSPSPFVVNHNDIGGGTGGGTGGIDASNHGGGSSVEVGDIQNQLSSFDSPQLAAAPLPHLPYDDDNPAPPKTYHSCYRPCSMDPATKMTCSYNFTVANYFVLSPPHCGQCPNVTADCYRYGCLAADGRQRVVTVVNKMLGGPPIRVCEGDTVVVDVKNKLGGQETTIHWHGIHQQGTPFMDGVPNLTQCPITQDTTFRYQFETTKPGTYFYHSHAGVQRADGVAGALIVRRAPEVDYHRHLYDYDLADHEIMVWDWLSELSIVGHIRGHVTDDRELPRSILVNGKGIPPGFFDNYQPYDTLQGRGIPFVPIEEFRVQQGFSYRFRIISNGVTLCPVELSIENHPMLVISSDGFDVKPVSVQSFVMHAGERFDFVLTADQPIGSYWMKFRGLLDCNMTSTFQLALLNYEGTPVGALPDHTISTWVASAPAPGFQLNPLDMGSESEKSMTIAEMSSVQDDDPEIIERIRPDHQFYVSFDFNRVSNVNFGVDHKTHFQKLVKEKRRDQQKGIQREKVNHFLPQLNFITHLMPSAPPLTQPETLNYLDTCNEQTKLAENFNCTKRICKCTHLLKVALNSIVEIVLVDRGIRFDAAHPFHLHGHSFRVVALERLSNSTEPELVQALDAQGLIERRRANAPIKDTVYVPDGGYTIIRFRANNPGFWFFHCHVEFHAERGMSLIVQVGEPSQFAQAPRNFPTCGDYLPPVGSTKRNGKFRFP